MKVRRLVGAAGAAVLLVAGAPSVGHADPAPAVSYPFADDAQGWESEVRYSGVCLPIITCTVTGSHRSTDGAGGADDGYLRTEFSAILVTGLGTSTGVWSSPAFTYSGHGGSTPGAVSIDLRMRVAMAELLELSLGDGSTYQVDLVDVTDGDREIAALPATTLTAGTVWTSVPTIDVPPSLLTIGHQYRLRITTTYATTAAVLGSGEVGYDDVRLSVAAPSSTGPSSGDDGGAGGGKSGTTVPTPKKLKKIARKHVLPDRVELSGRAIRVRTECPPQAGAACRVQVRGLSRGTRSRTATRVKTAKLDPNRARTLQLRIKPRHLPAYRDARRVTLRSRVTVGGVKVIVAKKVRVLR